MYKDGEIRRAKELGRAGRALYIWCSCPSCGKYRWEAIRHKDILCQPCSAQKRARELKPVTYYGIGVPNIGDTAVGKQLGYNGNGILHYDPCRKCGKPHWVRNTSRNTLCIHCIPKKFGRDNPQYQGETKTKRGYIYIKIDSNDPMYAMAKNGWVLEHRLVVARREGRLLNKGEVVHHINGIKSDNRPSNLMLLKYNNHNSHMVTKDLKSRISILEKRVTELEAQNILYEYILSEVRDSVLGGSSKLQRYNTQSSREAEGIVRTFSNKGIKQSESALSLLSLLIASNDGASIEQSMDKHSAKSGKPKHSIMHGNPELAESVGFRASVETLYGTSQVDEEKVHPYEKS